MSDLISRQAAISEIMEDIKDRSLHDDPATPEDYAEGYDEGIRNAAVIVLQMPSAQPGWIPVTERLPEDNEEVLFCDNEGERWLGWHYGFWKTERLDFDEDDVVAWMPLPTPYLEGEQDEQN